MHRLAYLIVVSSSVAWAGGFELPGNGTQALGRGAAFTAKADDATAMEYNVSGLARQRGTQLLINGNLLFHDYEFQRAGNYPVEMPPPGETAHPWSGQPYPLVKNSIKAFFAPQLGITTDFGKLDRWTFGIGVFGPSAVGHREFGQKVTVNGVQWPSPARYDLISANLLIVFPTLAAAVRVTKWLDIGLALHIAVGRLEFETASYAPLGPGVCYSAEYQPCDALTKLSVTGATATAAIGMMARPIEQLQLGFNLRGPVYMKASGEVSTPGPEANPLPGVGTGTFSTQMPWVLRLGMRYRFLRDGFEHGDLEANFVYEAWGAAEGEGDELFIIELPPIVRDTLVKVPHKYHDTYGLRLGGAYNIKLPKGELTLRVGGYFDSSATMPGDTRLDFDTMYKVAGTFGLGYRIRGVSINLAYAYVWSPDRTVTTGRLRQINGVDGTNTSPQGDLPVVNNGRYHAQTQMLSIGLTVWWDEALKKQRVIKYE